jgi:hypothetical protein
VYGKAPRWGHSSNKGPRLDPNLDINLGPFFKEWPSPSVTPSVNVVMSLNMYRSQGDRSEKNLRPTV